MKWFGVEKVEEGGGKGSAKLRERRRPLKSLRNKERRE